METSRLDLRSFKRVSLLCVHFGLISYEVEVAHLQAYKSSCGYVSVVAIYKLDLPLVNRVVNVYLFLVKVLLALNCIQVALQLLAINLHKLFVHLFLKLQKLLVKNAGSLPFSLLYTLLQDLPLFTQLLDDLAALL